MSLTEALLCAAVVAFIAGRGLHRLALLAALLLLFITVALSPAAQASDMPPFTIGHPLCQTGFSIAQRYDQRNAAGAIIKSVWVRKCVRVPKIIYR